MRSVYKVCLAGSVVLSLTACGLESALVDAFSGDPEVVTPVPPVGLHVTTEGLTNPTFHIFNLTGDELLSATGELQAEGDYLIPVDSTLAGSNLIIVAQSGDIVLKGLLFCFQPPTDVSTSLSITLDASTTAATLVAESLGTWRGDTQDALAINPFALASYAADELELTYATIQDAIDSGSGEAFDFSEEVSRVIDAGSETSVGAPMFVLAATSGELLQADFLSAVTVDYDDDGVDDTDPAAFNAAAAALAGQARLAIDDQIEPATYTDPANGQTYPYYTVIFTVHAGTTLEAGNCSPPQNGSGLCGGSIICDDGDSMFFTGGLHVDSPIQDAALQLELGNFKPNTVPMYDDGSHGDEVANDTIYTITFRLPQGLRIGYKYTWGRSAEGWSGTEEWPGNQRILEVQDNNGDGYVWRDDVIRDEASNKDKSNCYAPGCKTNLDWTTDLNGDGFPEAQEHPLSAALADAALHTVTLTGLCYQNADLYEWVYPSRSARSTAGACQ